MAAALLLLAAARVPATGAGAASEKAEATRLADPLARCTADRPNLQFGTPYPATQVEPHVVALPGAGLVAAWQQDRWSSGGSRGVVAAASRDGGATWTPSSPTRSSVCTGGTKANGGGYGRATDPWLAAGAGSDVYLVTLSVDQELRSPFGVNPDALLVSRSRDGGRSWTPPVTVVRDGDPTVYNDKPSVAADPAAAGSVHVVWTRNAIGAGHHEGPAWLATSTDGGGTWGRARPIFDPPHDAEALGNQILAVPGGAGALHSRFVDVFTLVSHEHHGATPETSVAAIRSDDGGRTWSAPISVAETKPVPVTDPLTGRGATTGESLADAAVDARTGTLFVVWADAGFSDGVHNDVALSMSTDGGRSWTEPVRVNRTPRASDARNRQAFLPAVEVAGDGTVGVLHYDLRSNGPDRSERNPLEADVFLIRCSRPSAQDDDRCADAGGWSETRLTRRSFDLRRAPQSPGLFLGDYVGLTAVGDGFVALFARTAAGRPSAVVAVTATCPGGATDSAASGCPGAPDARAPLDRPVADLAGPAAAERSGSSRPFVLLALAALLAASAVAAVAVRRRRRKG